jgi:hypothetical protein
MSESRLILQLGSEARRKELKLSYLPAQKGLSPVAFFSTLCPCAIAFLGRWLSWALA